MRPRHLLFVCSGNICRSPMAEGLAGPMADRIGLDVEARSAGTLGLVDRAADPKAVAVCSELRIDISGHRSQGVSHELIAWADHVLVMEITHASHLREHFVGGEHKVELLGPYAGTQEIADPIGGWTWHFRRSRKLLERAVTGFLTRHA